MTTIIRNPRLSTRSPKAEFALAYAVNARDADNMEKKILIPSGTDIIIMRRFGRLPSSGKSMVEFALAEPSGDEVGKFYRAWSDELVPVGSKRAKEMTQAKAKGGFMSNPNATSRVGKAAWFQGDTTNFIRYQVPVTIVSTHRTPKYGRGEEQGFHVQDKTGESRFTTTFKANRYPFSSGVSGKKFAGVQVIERFQDAYKLKNPVGDLMPNSSTRNPKPKFLWNRMRTGHWQGIYGGMTRAYIRKGGSGKYYVEMPGPQGGMMYPQVEFDSLKKAQEWVEEHAKGGVALNPATTAPGKIKNIDGAVVLRNPGHSAVGRTYFRKDADKLAKAWQKVGFTTSIHDSPAVTSNKTIYTVYVNGHVPSISGGEFEMNYPLKGRDYSPPLSKNPSSGVRIIHNRLLGGWFVVRGPHQTPITGRFDSKTEAEAWLKRPHGGGRNPLLRQTTIDAIRFIPASFDPYQGRVPRSGFGGGDYAISISKGAFQSLTGSDDAIAHPNTWVVLKQSVKVFDVSKDMETVRQTRRMGNPKSVSFEDVATILKDISQDVEDIKNKPHLKDALSSHVEQELKRKGVSFDKRMVRGWVGRWMSEQNPMSKLSHTERRKLSVPQQHQLRIARDTLNMPDAMVGVMGGPNKAQAREIIKRLTGKAARENPSKRNPMSTYDVYYNHMVQGKRISTHEFVVASTAQEAIRIGKQRLPIDHLKHKVYAKLWREQPKKNPLSTCPGCGKPISNQDAEPGVYTCDGCKAAVRVT